MTIVSANAQNLVANGNCDTYSLAPTSYGQVCRATGWVSPSGTCSIITGKGSPDYYNTNGSGGAKPPSTFWSNVMPHSGTGMQGFAGYYTSGGSPYREYIQYQLSAPMVPGVLYQISFYITNGTTTFHGYGCNHIGVYFSNVAVTQTGGVNMPYIPQVQDTTVLFSTTWQLKTFTFTPSVAYTHITIGNFYNNVNTTIQQFVNPSTVVGAYYYVDDVVVQPAVTLPVELLSFEGSHHGDRNTLSWITGSEWNNDFFFIARSTDGVSFSTIGKMEGQGTTSSVHEYRFHDTGFDGPLNYYRLCQTDFDGSYRFSDVIAIRSDVNPASVLPFVHEGQLNWAGDETGKRNYVVYSITGQAVLAGTLAPGEKNKVDITSLPHGFYLLRLSGDGEKVFRIVY